MTTVPTTGPATATGTTRTPGPLAAVGRRRLAYAGLLLGLVGLLAANVAASNLLRPVRIDFTEENLYTLAPGTHSVLAALDEPVTVRLYYSRILGERSPAHAAFHARVRGLLQEYADLAGGLLKVEFIDPEPFSEAEDRAVAFGLQGVPVNTSGDLGYFGLAATNSVDTQEVVPFFNTEREAFIEYDLTRLLHGLLTTKKKTIGLLSTLPVDGAGGAPMAAARPWLVMEQIRSMFEVRTLGTDLAAVPADIDVLMVVQPKGLPDKTLYAIDQYAVKGGRILAFVDPVAESDTGNPRQAMFGGAAPNRGDLGGFVTLMTAWGVTLDPDKVAGNVDAARRVNAGRGLQAVIADYIAWLSLGRDTFDTADAVIGGVDKLNVASAGILQPVTGATTTMTPIVATSPRSMSLAAQKITAMPDVVEMVRAFRSENTRLTVAARLSGPVRSAFTDGPPAPPPPAPLADDGRDPAARAAAEKEAEEARAAAVDKAKAAHLAESQQPLNAIIVADTDVLVDDFWVQRQDFFGQRLAIPVADNGDFLLNALENLAGSEALAGLRGRGRTDRPFELVEAIRRESEMAYRAKEQELLKRIEDVRQGMRTLEARETKAGEALLTTDEKKALEDYRRELLAARRELRAVKHALAKDIDRLDAWIKFVNIAGVPLVLAGIAGVVAVRRRPGQHAPEPKTRPA